MAAALTEDGPAVVSVTVGELMGEFIQVMRDWGHYRTAEGLRFPTEDEAREVASGRRTDRGWNTSPLP